jgi:hypothetical protein
MEKDQIMRAALQSLPIEGLLFYPWKGLDYEAGYAGIRTLILGESNYPGGNLTREIFEEQYARWKQTWFNGCILEYLDGKSGYRFWRTWLRAFLGHVPMAEEPAALLSRISFYNFGDIMLPQPRMPIPEEVIPEAAAKFRRVFKTLQPQLMVTLCYRLYEHKDCLPSDGEAMDNIEGYKTWRCQIESGTCQVLSLPHPSIRVWDAERATQAVKAAVSQISQSGHE